MSAVVRISILAQRDIEAALLWTLDHFGPKQQSNYRQLIRRAILDVARDPNIAHPLHDSMDIESQSSGAFSPY
jgi:plasmid stabilization system protein ParE